MPLTEKSMQPAMVIMCGLIGTGKSTLAAALAKRTGYNVLRSDEIRKELAGLDKHERRLESFGEGIYSQEFFAATYEALLERATGIIEKGEGVILDASFKKSAYRLGARKVAAALNIPFLLVECSCPDEIVKRRLEKREREGVDVSDGRWAIFHNQKSDFENITEIRDREHLIINTDKSVENNVAAILGVLDAARKGQIQ